jgi:signal transduction histidine kinase
MAQFTVDTHLFRELGELLVGRDSTALVELIKNSYDADATIVSVEGEHLDNPLKGRIRITDDGIGMNATIFEQGFLRIASRIKEQGERRSPLYKRRFTGAKGIGRLAAHKLAKRLRITSVPDPRLVPDSENAISAMIDWSKIESYETLEEAGKSDAVTIDEIDAEDQVGTRILLTDLRRKWTPAERTRVIREINAFQPPKILVAVPDEVHDDKLLFVKPRIRDVLNKGHDPGFEVRLLGEFDVGDEYWDAVAQAADWILEIKTTADPEPFVHYLVTPTLTCKRTLPNAEQHRLKWENPTIEVLPSLTARILIREGSGGFKKDQHTWALENAGVRVFMEGFRILPFGEAGNDWLEIDRDNVRRGRSLRYLEDTQFDKNRNGRKDEDEGLSQLSNSSYFGAVFLTQQGNPKLEMLVNREGFIPNAAFISLHKIIRVGIDLTVRIRASERRQIRDDRRTERLIGKRLDEQIEPERLKTREAAEKAVAKATEFAREARAAAAAGNHSKAEELITSAAQAIKDGADLSGELVTDRSIMQILAGVGLQMSAFVHEINGLLGMATAIEASLDSIRLKPGLDRESQKELSILYKSMGDLRRIVERQASYLSDITSPDARRRRSRQILSDRFDAATRLVQRVAEIRNVEISNKIPIDLKSPPMFPAELTVIFSNLLTNAVKACRKNGRIRASGRIKSDKTTILRVENTGDRVRLSDSEKWFLPFKSTTVEADPVLGQGMGMGLPIVRNILEEYGASIQFVEPREDFATAIEITFR